MIPAAFEYARAGSIQEALDLLAGSDGSVRALAGGQSILPLMKLRLARPERLIDIGRLTDLRGVRETRDGGLAIGALTTWATLLADEATRRIGALADALPQIGDVQVRNLGTIGGSLAHADPASDIAAAALALGFELVARSAAQGERTIAIDAFFQGPFMTALEPDELLVEVRVPASAARMASAYVALPQLASGYPIAGVAVSLSPDNATECRVGVTGVGELPYRATAIEAAIARGIDPREAMPAISDGQRVNADIHADREYRAAMAVVMARRAFDAATARATAT